MGDITQHEWSDVDVMQAEPLDGNPEELFIGLADCAANSLTINEADSRALAEHFGLLTQWMTREAFEAGLSSPATYTDYSSAGGE